MITVQVTVRALTLILATTGSQCKDVNSDVTCPFWLNKIRTLQPFGSSEKSDCAHWFTIGSCKPCKNRLLFHGLESHQRTTSLHHYINQHTSLLFKQHQHNNKHYNLSECNCTACHYHYGQRLKLIRFVITANVCYLHVFGQTKLNVTPNIEAVAFSDLKSNLSLLYVQL